MGGVQAKIKNKNKKSSMALEEGLREKVKLLEREICEMMVMRETESQAFDQDMMVFILKETEWKAEREKLKEEIDKLINGNINYNWSDQRMISCRDEAVERWKKLYLAIKVELDDLIQNTHGRLSAGDEENEELKTRVRDREETIEILQDRLASMEQEQMRKDREMDILRQSLRIMCHYNNFKKMKLKKKKKKNQIQYEHFNFLNHTIL